MDHPGVRFPPPLIFLIGLAAGLGIDAALDGGVPAALRVAGGVLAVAGLALLATFLGAFRRAGNAPEPWKPDNALVTDGVYAVTRNPGYLGMALVSAGIALLADAPWALATLPVVLVVVDRYVIAREERYLAQLFGADYDAYRSRVRRWV